MKLVVTGATGNVGTALLKAVHGRRWTVTGVARRRPATDRPPFSSARWISCDIGTEDAVKTLTAAFTGADAVVHLAWAIHPRSGDPPMHRTNVLGTAHVLRAVAAAGVPRLVCASSVAAYAPAPRWERVREDWPRTGVPGSAYSAGKATLEAQLDAFTARHPGTRVARVRPCGIAYGAAGAEFSGMMLGPWLPRFLLGSRWLPIPLWPGFRVQIVHAEDVAAAIGLILRHEAAGAFNLAAEPVLGAKELGEILGGLRLPVPLGLLTPAAWLGWRLGLTPLHPAWLVLADRVPLMVTARAREELGWSPRHDAAAALEELLAGMRQDRTVDTGPLAPPRGLSLPGRPTHQSQAC
ncbi:NAD-dependent epimerase/dehydratase family protein [Amycolatopsis rhizosphaerae]|uniref:NAD-dependent epimerase/dehydratase family protein n=1 Tax=Amycolatopsis rhizosphaerae TaxID=2053003 RepID=A0A558C871_9PSEU|nr:NAD-dependent epimerase/dehydratase family protein [Amycolatopsis rhizosphaerae]TVT44975.1 NAD-dependent epimerase/dehydratase family protein [Amycolatopsis rhizosphaerae]